MPDGHDYQARVQSVKTTCKKICELWADMNYVFLGSKSEVNKQIEHYVIKSITLIHLIKNAFGASKVTPYLTEVAFVWINIFRRVHDLGIVPSSLTVGPLEEHHGYRKSLLALLKGAGFPEDFNEFYLVKLDMIIRCIQLRYGNGSIDIEKEEKRIKKRKDDFQKLNILFEHSETTKKPSSGRGGATRGICSKYF